jgi:tRNA pseudouridine55 synthase
MTHNPASGGGIFGVYKPKGPTSFDVVARIRRITGIKKVGHAGTLDPLAEGVLVVAIGAATKKLQEVVAKEKEYEAIIRLGVTSTTDDEEGEKHELPIPNIPISNKIQKVLEKFVGTISQVPPAYSAVKIKGKAAYTYARRGKEIEIKAREVLVKEIILRRYKWPFLELSITTGPGVYIRALARDIGQELGVGGYMTALKRTRVGEFMAEKAVVYNNLENYLKVEKIKS